MYLRCRIRGRVRKAGIVPTRRSMRRMVAILVATALVSVSGDTACSGIQEDLQKREQEEVEKERKKVEKKVQEKVQEGQKRIEEEVKKGQQQVKEKAQ